MGRTDTGSNISVLDVYSYGTTVPDVPLAPGHYFLSIVNNTAGTLADWYWADSSQSGNAFARSIDTNPWVPDINTTELSFNLTDDLVAAVPEPTTLALLGLGLAGLGFSRRRKQ